MAGPPVPEALRLHRSRRRFYDLSPAAQRPYQPEALSKPVPAAGSRFPGTKARLGWDSGGWRGLGSGLQGGGIHVLAALSRQGPRGPVMHSRRPFKIPEPAVAFVIVCPFPMSHSGRWAKSAELGAFPERGEREGFPSLTARGPPGSDAPSRPAPPAAGHPCVPAGFSL